MPDRKSEFNLEQWAAVEREIRDAKANQNRASAAPGEVLLCLHPRAAEVLFQIAVATNARRILEIGTNAGYSALWLARACAVTGGRVISLELNNRVAAIADDYLTRARVADRVVVQIGDARTLIPTVPAPVDLAFIDAEKSEYVDYIRAVWPKLVVNGSVVADNVISHPETTAPYLEYCRGLADAHTVILEVGNGLGWTVKLAS